MLWLDWSWVIYTAMAATVGSDRRRDRVEFSLLPVDVLPIVRLPRRRCSTIVYANTGGITTSPFLFIPGAVGADNDDSCVFHKLYRLLPSAPLGLVELFREKLASPSLVFTGENNHAGDMESMSALAAVAVVVVEHASKLL